MMECLCQSAEMLGFRGLFLKGGGVGVKGNWESRVSDCFPAFTTLSAFVLYTGVLYRICLKTKLWGHLGGLVG